MPQEVGHPRVLSTPRRLDGLPAPGSNPGRCLAVSLSGQASWIHSRQETRSTPLCRHFYQISFRLWFEPAASEFQHRVSKSQKTVSRLPHCIYPLAHTARPRLCGFLTPLSRVSAQNLHLGDLDDDGTVTVRDLALLNDHISGTPSLLASPGPFDASHAVLADMNKDGAMYQGWWGGSDEPTWDWPGIGIRRTCYRHLGGSTWSTTLGIFLIFKTS